MNDAAERTAVKLPNVHNVILCSIVAPSVIVIFEKIFEKHRYNCFWNILDLGLWPKAK